MGRWRLGGIAALSKSALLPTPCERLFNALAIETVRADRKRYANDFSALRELVFGPGGFDRRLPQIGRAGVVARRARVFARGKHGSVDEAGVSFALMRFIL